jgi:hypothetical protein
MASIAVIAFNCVRLAFSGYVAFWRQNIGKGIPIIGVKNAIFQAPYLVVEPFECCAVTTTGNPGDSSPAATVKGFDKLKFLFFDSIKCHISSNSIWVISPPITFVHIQPAFP